jgi:hypothetical protein
MNPFDDSNDVNSIVIGSMSQLYPQGESIISQLVDPEVNDTVS